MISVKYSPDEILQILIDFYNYQSAFDPEVGKGEVLTFETAIFEWRDICDLVEPKKLAKYYSELFQLTMPPGDFEDLLSRKGNNLKVLCDYLSEHAVKQSISPILIMGRNCMTASIFRTLKNKLQIRGVEIQNLRPSSKFEPLFKRHGSVFVEEVNKLVPGSLSKFENEENWIVKQVLLST